MAYYQLREYLGKVGWEWSPLGGRLVRPSFYTADYLQVYHWNYIGTVDRLMKRDSKTKEETKTYDTDWMSCVARFISIMYLGSLIFDIITIVELINSGEFITVFLGWFSIIWFILIYIISGILHRKIGINKYSNSLVSYYKFAEHSQTKNSLENTLMILGSYGTILRCFAEFKRKTFRQPGDGAIVSEHQRSGLLLLLYTFAMYPLYLC